MILRCIFCVILAAVLAANALAVSPFKVVTTTTDLAIAAKEIGGDKIIVKPLLKGTENPHYIDAIPDFIREVADAKVVCLIGLDLEIGWLPKVLSKSGNAAVQPGGPGYCDTGTGVTVLEKPTGPVNRSMGDVHPAGNPHFTLSPVAFSEAANAIAQALARVDPGSAAFYQTNLKKFQEQLRTLQRQLASTLPKPATALVMEYHREFAYFFQAYGLRSFGSLEEKPGVAPSAGRIAEIARSAQAAGVKVLIATDYTPKKALEKFSELSGIPVKLVASFPRADSVVSGPRDYREVQQGLVTAVAEALQPK